MAYRNRPVPPGRLAHTVAFLAFVAGYALLPACSSDGDGAGPTNTGQACASVDPCYPGVKDGDLLGDAVCLDKVTGGYCTHECTKDSDCCAAAGECPDAHSEVCAPFESTPEKYCFLSCEDADVDATTLADADQYCKTYAGSTFGCRSTGGGSQNRKICMP